MHTAAENHSGNLPPNSWGAGFHLVYSQFGENLLLLQKGSRETAELGGQSLILDLGTMGLNPDPALTCCVAFDKSPPRPGFRFPLLRNVNTSSPTGCWQGIREGLLTGDDLPAKNGPEP